MFTTTRNRFTAVSALLSLISLCYTPELTGQENTDLYTVTRISEKVTLDGQANEAFWASISPLKVTRQSPDYEAEPSEETTIKIAYDDDHFYVMAIMHTEDFENVQDYSLQRDADCPCDWLGFALGGDGANPPSGFGFATTPSGNRWDSFLVDGTQISIDASFNTFWDVASTKDPEVGWTAEFAIPWSSLRFSDVNPEEVLMQFVIWRKLTYNNEFEVYPNIPPNWGVLSFAKLSKGQTLKFSKIEAEKPLYLFPYGLMGYQQEQVMNEAGDGFVLQDQWKREIGIDLKYSLNPRLTLDATINTDFAQVEADNIQINLERSSLFFPEKREFFLERNDKFDFGFTGFNPTSANFNNAFYSRRIGLENGQPSRIYGGLRLVGRAGENWDVGALNMLPENSNGLSDVQNLSAFRLKRQLAGEDTYIGGIITSRIQNGDEYEYSVGLDARMSVLKNNFLRLALAQSQNSNDPGFSLDQLRYDIRLDKLIEKGWFYTLSSGLVGERYNPTLGFEERGSRWNQSYRLGYGLFEEDSKNVFRHVFSSNGWIINSYDNFSLESIYLDLGYRQERKNGSGFSLTPVFQVEHLANPLPFSSDVMVPVGEYEFASGILGYFSPSVYALSLNSSLSVGQFYDGDKTTINTNIRWDASRFFKLTLNYQYDDIRFGERNQSLTNHLMGLTSLVMFDTKLSVSGLVQYNAINDLFGSNIRFRYNPSERRDLFIVFNNNVNTIDMREGIALPRTQSWNIQVKYTHVLNIK